MLRAVAGEHVEGLATAGTLSPVCGEIMNHILRGEVLATFSPVALGPRLLTSLASRHAATGCRRPCPGPAPDLSVANRTVEDRR